MTMTMTPEELDKWFAFLGYGNPHSRLWFVGIEPGGAQATEPMPRQDTVQFYGEPVLFDKNLPTDSNRVWNVAKTLAESAKAGEYFLSNIAPLPKRAECDALRAMTPAEYHARIVSKRVPLLKRLHECNKSRITVFHGAGARRRYGMLQAFGIDEREAQRLPSGVMAFEPQRLIFTNSFSRGNTFSNKAKTDVASYLIAWRAQG